MRFTADQGRVPRFAFGDSSFGFEKDSTCDLIADSCDAQKSRKPPGIGGIFHGHEMVAF